MVIYAILSFFSYFINSYVMFKYLSNEYQEYLQHLVFLGLIELTVKRVYRNP